MNTENRTGLDKGFVKFGTTHEAVLRHLHVVGVDTLSGVCEDLGMLQGTASSALHRLVAAGLVFKLPKLPVTQSGRVRPEMRFTLTKPEKAPKPFKRLTNAQRMRRHRAKRAAEAARPVALAQRVSSVFQLGEMAL